MWINDPILANTRSRIVFTFFLQIAPAAFVVLADDFDNQVGSFPSFLAGAIRMFFRHENDVGLPDLTGTEPNAEWREYNFAEIVGGYKTPEKLKEKTHNTLMCQRWHWQDLDVSIGKLHQPVSVLGKTEVFSFVQVALIGKKALDLRGQWTFNKDRIVACLSDHIAFKYTKRK